jgi:hypothetical protein
MSMLGIPDFLEARSMSPIKVSLCCLAAVLLCAPTIADEPRVVAKTSDNKTHDVKTSDTSWPPQPQQAIPAIYCFQEPRPPQLLEWSTPVHRDGALILEYELTEEAQGDVVVELLTPGEPLRLGHSRDGVQAGMIEIHDESITEVPVRVTMYNHEGERVLSSSYSVWKKDVKVKKDAPKNLLVPVLMDRPGIGLTVQHLPADKAEALIASGKARRSTPTQPPRTAREALTYRTDAGGDQAPEGVVAE